MSANRERIVKQVHLGAVVKRIAGLQVPLGEEMGRDRSLQLVVVHEERNQLGKHIIGNNAHDRVKILNRVQQPARNDTLLLLRAENGNTCRKSGGDLVTKEDDGEVGSEVCGCYGFGNAPKKAAKGDSEARVSELDQGCGGEVGGAIDVVKVGEVVAGVNDIAHDEGLEVVVDSLSKRKKKEMRDLT